MKFTHSLAALAAMGLTLSALHSASANMVTPFETRFDTDYVSAGYGGMRDIGTGSITLSGVSGTVNKAYLYWHGPAQTLMSNANADVNFNGNDIVGTNIGSASDNCWGYAISHAYRADVTSLVSGNGVYTLDNFMKDSGRININGVSLLVFFDDGDGTNNRDIVLFDGNDSNISSVFDPDGWDVNLSGINYTSGSASMELHVADGQTFGDDAIIINGNVVAPAGGIFQGDSVPNGASAAATNGGLWDIKDFDVTSLLSPGPNDLHMTTGTFSDCLGLVVVAINLPAGAAPPTDVPEPGTVAMLIGMAVPGVSMVLRRRRNK